MASVRIGREERGSAVPFAVMVVGVLVSATVAFAWVAGIVVADRRAESAADLAALAAAADGCGAGAHVAARNGAELTACAPSGDEVTVTVAVGSARASSRAGVLS